MDAIIKDLLAQVESSDLDIQEEALVQLGFVLQKSNTIQYGDDDSDWFPAILHNLRLNLGEQAEVAATLADVFLAGKCRKTGLLATLKQATRTAAVGPLLRAIGNFREHLPEYDPRTIEQAVDALIVMLHYPVKDDAERTPIPIPEVAEALVKCNPENVLAILIQANHPYYSEMAKEALCRALTYGEAHEVVDSKLLAAVPPPHSNRVSDGEVDISWYNAMAMKWSKLKKTAEELLAASLQGRVQYHYTRYGPGESEIMTRAWITLDQEEILTASTAIWIREFFKLPLDMRQARLEDADNLISSKAHVNLLQQNILSTYQFVHSLELYLGLPIDAAMASPNPIIRAFSMLDRRLGKRRLKQIKLTQTEHECSKKCYEIRCEAEGLKLSANE
ncbi:MAG: hypothetical protein HY866_13865 [Chloroflexi bacterium]|nr:hypothetical protein [Chloroflexota bacterium]